MGHPFSRPPPCPTHQADSPGTEQNQSQRFRHRFDYQTIGIPLRYELDTLRSKCGVDAQRGRSRKRSLPGEDRKEFAGSGHESIPINDVQVRLWRQNQIAVGIQVRWVGDDVQLAVVVGRIAGARPADVEFRASTANLRVPVLGVYAGAVACRKSAREVDLARSLSSAALEKHIEGQPVARCRRRALHIAKV